MKKNITINVQREDRLAAIRDLALSNRLLAEALKSSVQINITDCTFRGSETHPGLQVQPLDDVARTEIIEIENDQRS